MGRAVNEASITTRNVRSKLPAGKTVHWRAIDRGAHLGYRKGKDGGTWVARHRKPDGTYVTDAIGNADDAVEADGVKVLSYSQALKRARAWCEHRARPDAGDAEEPVKPFTVADAMADYLDYLAAEKKTARDARYRIGAHILPALGAIEVAKLTTKRLREWHWKLAAARARLRTRSGAAQNYRETADEPEAVRRRRASANRTLTIFKAALNRAFGADDEKVSSALAWQRVKPFRNVDAPRVDYLTEAECTRLVNACAPDFRKLVLAALYTGARYGELAAMRVGDFNSDAGTVFVRPSKSSKARHVYLTAEGAAFFAEAAAGRGPQEILFLRANGKTWRKSEQARPLAEAAKTARLGRTIGFHVTRHTHASQLTMAGVPLAVIAEQLGHADIRMVSKHYGHLSPSYVADAIRAGLPTLGLHRPGNLMSVRPAAS